MVKAYYKNSKGEVLWLTRVPYRTIEADWYDSTWEENADGYEKTITIDVFGRRSEFVQNMERLYKIISVDSETGKYGQLYVNGTFLPCQIYKTTMPVSSSSLTTFSSKSAIPYKCQTKK